MGETTGVNVLNGGKRGPDDLFSCPHYTLEALAAGDGASTVPYSDAAAQDALYNSSVIPLLTSVQGCCLVFS